MTEDTETSETEVTKSADADDPQPNREDNEGFGGLSVSRRQVLGGLASIGVLGSIASRSSGAAGSGDVSTNIGGGNMTSEISNLEIRTYRGQFSERPAAGVDGRVYEVDDPGHDKHGAIYYDNGSSWELVDRQFGKVSAGSASIDGTPVPGYNSSIRNVTSDGDHNSEPQLTQITPTEALMVHRLGDSHTDNNGKQVGRIYDLETDSWGSQFTIVDDASYDDRNTVLFQDEESGRLVLIYRTSDAATNDTQAIYKVESSVDDPTNWSSRTDITSAFSSTLTSDSSYVPFGPAVKTSNGWMVLAYNGADYVEAIFSTDGGQSWGSPTTVVDTSGFPLGNAAVNESTPVAITQDKIVVVGREEISGGHYAVRSSDGGATWENKFWRVFTPAMGGNPSKAVPIWAKRTGEYVTAMWGDRRSETVYAAQISADVFWKDPSKLALEPAKPIFEDYDNGDWGYPTFTAVGPSTDNLLAAWYSNRDSGGSPDIYAGTIPANIDGAENKRLGGGYLTDWRRGFNNWSGDTSPYVVDATAPTFDNIVSLKAELSASDTSWHPIHKIYNLPRYAKRGDTIVLPLQVEFGNDRADLFFFQQTADSQGGEPRYYVTLDASSDDVQLNKRVIDRSGSFTNTTIDSSSAAISSNLSTRLDLQVTPRKDGYIMCDLFAGDTNLASLGSGQDFEYSFGGIGFGARNSGTSNATTIAFGSPQVL